MTAILLIGLNLGAPRENCLSFQDRRRPSISVASQLSDTMQLRHLQQQLHKQCTTAQYKHTLPLSHFSETDVTLYHPLDYCVPKDIFSSILQVGDYFQSKPWFFTIIFVSKSQSLLILLEDNMCLFKIYLFTIKGATVKITVNMGDE